MRLSKRNTTQVRPGLAWNDGVFGVAYSDGGERTGQIRFLAVTADGSPVGAPVTLSEVEPAMSPHVTAAAPGEGFGVVWYAGGGNADDIFFARVSADGRPLTHERGLSESAGWSYAASVAFVDPSFVAVWLDERRGGLQVFARALDSDATHLGPIVQLTHDGERAARPTVVPAGPDGGAVVAWTRWPDGKDPIFVTTLDDELEPTPTVTVAEDDAPASHPTLLPMDDSTALVAWDDEPNGRILLRKVPLAATGEADSAPRPVARGSRAKQPALAGGPLVDGPVGLFWSDADETSDGARDLRFRLIETDGSPIGDALTVSDGPGDDLQAVAAWDGNGFGVVWFRSDRGDEAVFYAHVDPACGG